MPFDAQLKRQPKARSLTTAGRLVTMPSTALAPFLPTASPFPTPQPEASSSRPHPRTLLSSELLPHLSTLQSLESALSQDLHALLSDRTAIDSAHTRLHQLLPRIELVESEVNGVNGTGDDAGLVQRIGKVNEIAERIGGKVRDLDLELLRVKEASERLNEVMELKVRGSNGRARQGWLGLLKMVPC